MSLRKSRRAEEVVMLGWELFLFGAWLSVAQASICASAGQPCSTDEECSTDFSCQCFQGACVPVNETVVVANNDDEEGPGAGNGGPATGGHDWTGGLSQGQHGASGPADPPVDKGRPENELGDRCEGTCEYTSDCPIGCQCTQLGGCEPIYDPYGEDEDHGSCADVSQGEEDGLKIDFPPDDTKGDDGDDTKGDGGDDTKGDNEGDTKGDNEGDTKGGEDDPCEERYLFEECEREEYTWHTENLLLPTYACWAFQECTAICQYCDGYNNTYEADCDDMPTCIRYTNSLPMMTETECTDTPMYNECTVK